MPILAKAMISALIRLTLSISPTGALLPGPLPWPPSALAMLSQKWPPGSSGIGACTMASAVWLAATKVR